MKKNIILYLLVLGVLLVMPFATAKAAANVEVSKIELVEISDGVVVNNEPKANGLNIDFDLAFANIHDVVKYKVTIKNNDDKAYIMTNQTTQVSDYMKYEYVFADDNNELEANGEKEINIIITYESEVPTAALSGGKYEETNSVEFKLVNTATGELVENPKTSDNLLIYVNILIASLILCGIAIKTKKVRKTVAVFALLLVVIPTGVKALEEISFKLNSKIEISKDRKLCLTISAYPIGDFDFENYDFIFGNKWTEYVDSNLNEHFIYSNTENEVLYTKDADNGLYLDTITFVPANYFSCYENFTKDVLSILNGRDISELSEEEVSQVEAIISSDEFAAKRDACYKILEDTQEVNKNELIKPSKNGCYVLTRSINNNDN